MSYRTHWLTITDITQIAERFETSADYLLDEPDGRGAYASNVERKLLNLGHSLREISAALGAEE